MTRKRYVSHEENLLAFQYTGCLIGIPIIVYYNPYNISCPIYPKQLGFFHCSCDHHDIISGPRRVFRTQLPLVTFPSMDQEAAWAGFEFFLPTCGKQAGNTKPIPEVLCTLSILTPQN